MSPNEQANPSRLDEVLRERAREAAHESVAASRESEERSIAELDRIAWNLPSRILEAISEPDEDEDT